MLLIVLFFFASFLVFYETKAWQLQQFFSYSHLQGSPVQPASISTGGISHLPSENAYKINDCISRNACPLTQMSYTDRIHAALYDEQILSRCYNEQTLTIYTFAEIRLCPSPPTQRMLGRIFPVVLTVVVEICPHFQLT